MRRMPKLFWVAQLIFKTPLNNKPKTLQQLAPSFTKKTMNFSIKMGVGKKHHGTKHKIWTNNKQNIQTFRYWLPVQKSVIQCFHPLIPVTSTSSTVLWRRPSDRLDSDPTCKGAPVWQQYQVTKDDNHNRPNKQQTTQPTTPTTATTCHNHRHHRPPP